MRTRLFTTDFRFAARISDEHRIPVSRRTYGAQQGPAMNTEPPFYDGGGTCRELRYRMTSKPLFVHCCHCRWCQRETGASFALNALIEADRVSLLKGEVEVV